MNASDPHIRSAITQVAADWYAAHRVGPLPEAERAAFLAWLKASPIHIEEYLGVAALERALGAATAGPPMPVDAWVEMARMDPTGNVIDIPTPSGAYQGSHERTQPRTVRFGWRRVAAAACVGAAGMGALWVVLLRGGDHLQDAKTYRTGHGQQGAWALPDGSTLHVNTDTAVTVRFSPGERTVDVDHGQVAVEVARDDRRAFRVHAGSTNAVAVGTRFDVYRGPDSTLITVMTGQVAVSVGKYVPPRTAPSELPGGLRVGAGQQVKVVAGVLPPAPQPTDVRETTAWLERKIVFDQRPLGAVADEFNRYNDIPFTIDDPTLRSVTISGAFNAADTDSFAAFLESLDGVRVERLPTRFKVSSSHTTHGSPVRST
ncbi:MAG: FecR family transrane sensor protein [Gammaproteobacteria bacterium]|nr:FecR family transrane sensor protein [Gammaproteobacteria bacterium]